MVRSKGGSAHAAAGADERAHTARAASACSSSSCEERTSGRAMSCYMCRHTPVCVYVYMHVYMCIVRMYMCMYVCMYTCLYKYMYVSIYACMHVCILVVLYHARGLLDGRGRNLCFFFVFWGEEQFLGS